MQLDLDYIDIELCADHVLFTWYTRILHNMKYWCIFLLVSLFNIPIWISSYVNVISEPNILCVSCIFSYFLLFGTLLIIDYLLALYYVWLAVSIWHTLCGTIIFRWLAVLIWYTSCGTIIFAVVKCMYTFVYVIVYMLLCSEGWISLKVRITKSKDNTLNNWMKIMRKD